MSTPSLTEPQQVSESDQARRLRNGLVSLAILVLLIVGLLLAVPGLHVVGHLVAHMNLAWVGAGVLAEILSCLGYVLIFLTVFDRAPIVFGARVALTEMAFGAAVSLGGAGSIAVGAWLLRERGMATGRIAERSAVLFLLTSAINLLTLAGVGLAMGVGILPGPRNPLLTLLPAGICIAAFVFFLALPRLTEREAQVHPKRRLARVLHATGTTIRATRKTLLRPDWRLLGAIGYLWFDIGVLWACFQAIGHTPPIGVIVLSYQIGYLANVLPIPGNIGVLEGSFVGMLVLYGVHAAPAAAAAVVYHAIALWIPAIWGTFGFIRLRRSHDPLTPRPTREEREALRRERRALR
ncbi:MAG: lysylphosphatidylglycerol synthase transmembrane domain-containing protein [Solirubrobacteraceae bacterium]|jgi:uncharacterized membrane protein YbhN (UPF0104 family)